MSKYFNPEERAEELKEFKIFLAPLKGKAGQLMQALHHVQDEFGFIPTEIQELISSELRIPMAEVYGVITFYSRFTEIPKGKTDISICMGTACYVKGSGKVLEEIEKAVGVKAGHTTTDGLVSVTSTRCLGACSLAPVITVGHEVHGRLTAKDVRDLMIHLKYDEKARKEAEDFLAKEAI